MQQPNPIAEQVSPGRRVTHHDAPTDRAADGTSGQDARRQDSCAHGAVGAEQRERHGCEDGRGGGRWDVDMDGRYDEEQHCR